MEKTAFKRLINGRLCKEIDKADDGTGYVGSKTCELSNRIAKHIIFAIFTTT